MGKWGHGDDPRMLPPPLGREGVTLIAFFKRMESERSSPEPIPYNFFIGLSDTLNTIFVLTNLLYVYTSAKYIK